MKGNESLDRVVNQAVGKASYSRTGDNTVKWLQFIRDKEDFPLLTSQMVGWQKCDKCCMRFCSSINYKRHLRFHRRSFHFDKDTCKNKRLLGVFWDELSREEAKEITSFDNVWLKKIPGSSVLNTLVLSLNKPVVFTLSQLYIQSGSVLSDIIQNKVDKLQISSRDLIAILENTSEDNFLWTGNAESLQNEDIIDAEDEINVLLDLKNLVACISLLFEQKLVKAWFAHRDAEALKCQNLLVEEEAEKRQAKLDKKRQKKLRQKERKAKEQIKVDEATDTIIKTVDEPVDKVDTLIEGVNEAVSSEISISNSADQIEYSSKGNDDLDLKDQFDSQLELVNDDGDFINPWQVQKSRKNQSLKVDPVQKQVPEPKRDTSTKVYSRKVPQRDTSSKVKPVKRQERARETSTKVHSRKESERATSTNVKPVEKQEPERDKNTKVERERDTRSKVEVGIFDDKSFPELQKVTKTTQKIEDTSSSCKLMLGGSIPVHVSKSEPNSEKKDSDSEKAVLLEKLEVAAKRVVSPSSYEILKAFHDKRWKEAIEGEHEVLNTKKEEEPVSEADIQKPVSPTKGTAK